MITNYIDYKMPTTYSIKYIPHTCCIKIHVSVYYKVVHSCEG